MIDAEDREAIAEGRAHRLVEVVCEHDSRLAELLRVNRRDVLAVRVVEVVPRPVNLTAEAEGALVIDLADLDPGEYVLGPEAALPGQNRQRPSHHYLDALGAVVAVTSGHCCSRTIDPAEVRAAAASGRRRVVWPVR